MEEENLVKELIERAKQSKLNSQLASCLVSNGRIVNGSLSCNTHCVSGKNFIQGCVYSNHAEINSLLSFFGVNMRREKHITVLQEKAKGAYAFYY